MRLIKISESNNYKIDFVNQLSKDVEEKMNQGFIEYESSHGIDVDYIPNLDNQIIIALFFAVKISWRDFLYFPDFKIYEIWTY